MGEGPAAPGLLRPAQKGPCPSRPSPTRTPPSPACGRRATKTVAPSPSADRQDVKNPASPPPLQTRGPDFHLNRVPANTEAISNPSALGACANFPLFLHASPLLPISPRGGAYACTWYVRAPQLAFSVPTPFALRLELERAYERLPWLRLTMSNNEPAVSLRKLCGNGFRKGGKVGGTGKKVPTVT